MHAKPGHLGLRRRLFSGAASSTIIVETGFDWFDDFNAYADQTFLVPGGPTPALDWSAWSSTGAATDEKYNAVVRTGGDIGNRSTGYVNDFTSPGKYLIGRDSGAQDHHVSLTWTALRTNSGINVGATDDANRLFISSANVMPVRRYVAAAQTNLGNTPGGVSDNRDGGVRQAVTGDRIDVRVWNGNCYISKNGLPVRSAVSMGGLTGSRFGFSTYDAGHINADNMGAAALDYRLTLATLKRAYPRIQGLGGHEHGARDVPVSGTWECRTNTPPSGLHWRLIDYEFGDKPGYVWKDWAWVDTPEINNDGVLTGGVYVGTWSATIRVPCGLAGQRPYVMQVRTSDDTFAVAVSSYFAVTYTVLLAGQSNFKLLGTNAGYVNDHPGGFSYSPADPPSTTDAGMKTVTGWYNSQAELSSGDLNEGGLSLLLSVALDLPVHVINLAISATGALNVGPSGANASYLTTHLAYGGGAFDAILVSQGENEFIGTGEANLWKSRWRDINIPGFRAMSGQPGGTVIPAFFMITGRYNDTPGDPAAYNAAATIVRRAQREIVSEVSGAYQLGHHVGVAQAAGDSWHYEVLGANGYREIMRRAGLTVSKILANTGWSGVGPFATGASRSGAVITVAVDLNGADSLSGTALTSWEVATSADFSTGVQTISSAEVSGGNVVLTLAADPEAPVYVRNHAGYNPNVSSWVIGTYSDASTIPMLPVTVPLLSD